MTVVLIASLRHQLLSSIDFNIPSTSIGKGLRNNSKGKKILRKMLSQRALEASLEAQLL